MLTLFTEVTMQKLLAIFVTHVEGISVAGLCKVKNCLPSWERENPVNWIYQRVRMVLYHAESSDQREGALPSFNVSTAKPLQHNRT